MSFCERTILQSESNYLQKFLVVNLIPPTQNSSGIFFKLLEILKIKISQLDVIYIVQINLGNVNIDKLRL